MQKKSKSSDLEILKDLPVSVDILLLRDQFSHYRNPKKKIFDLMKKGDLRPIKRGQYFNSKSKSLETTPYELIANWLYYPSYISLEWALQYYGLILDRVTTVTSVTTKRSIELSTPYAPFSYKHIPKKRYPIGYVTLINKAEDAFLIATPAKALLDYINVRAKNLLIKQEQDIQEFLEKDLRLNLNEFLKMNPTQELKELRPFYHRNSKESRVLKWLIAQKEKKS